MEPAPLIVPAEFDALANVTPPLPRLSVLPFVFSTVEVVPAMVTLKLTPLMAYGESSRVVTTPLTGVALLAFKTTLVIEPGSCCGSIVPAASVDQLLVLSDAPAPQLLFA